MFATWCLAWISACVTPATQVSGEADGAQTARLAEPKLRAMEAELRADGDGFAALRELFESRNPGHRMRWMPATSRFVCKVPSVAFFQSDGEGYSIGDILCPKLGEPHSFDPPADLLVFELPQKIAADLPTMIRPDWDPKITDTPGGCATEGDAYRRILLTWQGKNGPYLSHQINAHRVRIHDSFTHYHPLKGGFDEFYLVQEAPPGATLLVGEYLDRMLAPKGITTGEAGKLLREIPLQKDDLIYLPRGVVHRGLGGAVVQVITIPGFVPGAEIPVDDEIRAINNMLELQGEMAVPCHRGIDYVEMRAIGDDTEIYIGGKPFTTVRGDRRLPDLWPLFHAAGKEVTRTWPRQKVALAGAAPTGEKEDHPHHQSLWFAHGKINGIDFWHDKKASVKQMANQRHSADKSAWVESRNEWRYEDKGVIATDHRRIDAFVEGDVRGLDFDITITGGKHSLTFGDTKEGSFALRMAPGLVVDGGAGLINDSGQSGGEVWGKRARWIEAIGKAGGKDAAVVIAGHRDNPRHPTYWHARKYGLLAANPFGVHDFTRAGKGAGDLTIAAEESLRLRYRVLVFARHPDAAEVEKLLTGFTSSKPE